MFNLDLCHSSTFEEICMRQCGQRGTFALISTTNPGSTPSRLNGGWMYHTGPRKGTRSPSLAYCNDWTVAFSCHIASKADLDIIMNDVRQRFDRPCLIPQIEVRLMKDDNHSHPGLAAKGMSKNGLDNVFCLRKGSFSGREEACCENEDDYEVILVRTVVQQVQAVVDETGIEEEASAKEEGDNNVTE